jgi:hypothetical protein
MLMHADTVAAWAQWVTAAIAGVAGCFARGQVLEARKTRERIAAPDVVTYIDHNPKNWQWFDLVIRNFGQTPAYNIRVTLPPLPIVPYLDARTGESLEHLYIPDTIAVLAPGQEWRTLWDSAINRQEHASELPLKLVGSVEFDESINSDKSPHRNPISLDTNMFRNMLRFAEDNTPKAIADNIAAVASTLRSYNNIHDRIGVYTVPGDEERRYRDERSAEHKAAHEHIKRALHGGSNPQSVRTS